MKKRLREPVSGLTHLVGGLLALAALIVLLRQAVGRVDQLVAFGIFGLSLVALYGASALYHLLPVSPPATARLRRLDHMTIFILIAGTYTPICVLALDGGWRAGLLGLIWTLALCGVVLKVLWMDAPRWLSVGIYLGMGWLAVIAASAIFRAIPPGGIAWILGGGLVYSAGALIYGLKRPNLVPGIFGFHELWHLFVMAGSACHFWVMLRYIAPISQARAVSYYTPFRGYCCLVLKRHAVELHDLGDAEAFSLMGDTRRVSRTLKDVTGAAKMNVDIYGNTLPHLHAHFFPRYVGDPYEDGPIDFRRSEDTREFTYDPEEFRRFVEDLRAAVEAA